MTEKYKIHAPFYLTEFFVIGYFTFFASFAAVLMHVSLWYGPKISAQIKAMFKQLDTSHGLTEDVHLKIMRNYQNIPEWAYFVYLLFFSLCAIFVCQFTPFKMPYWATIFAVFLGIFLAIPLGIIQAITGTQIGIQNAISVVIGILQLLLMF